MKRLIVLFFVLYGLTVIGQEKKIKKTEYVVIANNEIISEAALEEYGKKGLINAMNKGVTEESRNKLLEKFGNMIGDREFIVTVDLLTKQEDAERQNKSFLDNKTTSKEKNLESELKSNINDSASDFTIEMWQNWQQK